MTSPDYQDYYNFLANEVVTPFYEKRLQYLRSMTLSNILKRKNPYLLKAKNLSSSEEVVRSIVDAFLFSQEETMFGNLLEKFAIHISAQRDAGFKSTLPSIDLEFERGEIYYIGSIKSSTNWGNADQITAMKNNFKVAKEKLRVRGVAKEIRAVNGCMYGKDNVPLKNKKRIKRNGQLFIEDEEADKVYYKYAGQVFWEFISGDAEFYRKIIRPIDKKAHERDEAFKSIYIGKINDMTAEFTISFRNNGGTIDWVKLIDFVSKNEQRIT